MPCRSPQLGILFVLLAMAVLPTVAKAQSSQTYCHTEDSRLICNTYNSDGTLKQTHCQDGLGNTVNCNSYNSNGTMTQTNCRDSFGTAVNCTSCNSDGTMIASAYAMLFGPAPGEEIMSTTRKCYLRRGVFDQWYLANCRMVYGPYLCAWAFCC